MNYLEWIDCDERLPEEKQEGKGTVSETVKVILSDGTESEDWLINGKWVVHCKKNGGAYPIKWEERGKDGCAHNTRVVSVSGIDT